MSTLKFSDYIKEDPDDYWLSMFASTFGIISNCLIYCPINQNLSLADYMNHVTLAFLMRKAYQVLDASPGLKKSNQPYQDFFRSLLNEEDREIGALRFLPEIKSTKQLWELLVKLEDTDFYVNSGREAFDIAGRLNTSYKIISFWQHDIDVIPHINLIFQYIKKFGIDPEQIKYEFVNIDKLVSYSELNFPKQSSRSAEEIRQLLMKQHLDPSAKKALGQFGGGSIKQAQRALASGFGFPAQMHHALRQESLDYLLEMPYIELVGSDVSFDLELERFVKTKNRIGCINFIRSVLNGDPYKDKYGDILQLQDEKEKETFKKILLNNYQFNKVMQTLGISTHKLFQLQKNSFVQYHEDAMTSMGVFGASGSNYAPGDARMPKVLGSIQRRQFPNTTIKFNKKKKRKKKK